MSDKRVILVTHSEHAAPGPVAAEIERLGYRTEKCCPALGDALPALEAGRPNGYAAAVVFGGPQIVGEATELPYLRQEIDWVGGQLESGAPVLGICLGAQIMASVLGAEVGPHPEGLREIGYHPLRATAAGRPLFPDRFHAYQWHREGFTLPDSAVLLAEGEAFRNQAFRYGEAAYGIQFHPEMMPETMERWMTSEKGAPQLGLPGAQPAEAQRADAPKYDPPVRAWLRRFVAAWLASA